MPEDERLRHRLGLQVLFDFPEIIEAIDFASTHGFGALEINLGNIRFAEQLRRVGERCRIRRRAARVGLRLAIHALEGPSFFIPSERVRRCAVAELKETLNRAESIGAENVIMHLGFDMHYGMGSGGNRYTHEEFPRYYEEALFSALSELKDFARGRARLCVENVGGFRFQPAKVVLPRVLGESLGLCFDIGHIALLPEERHQEELNFFRRFRRYIYHSHLHDNHGVRDEHLPLGAGSNELLTYFRLLLTTRALLVLETRPRSAALRARDYFIKVILPGL